MADIAWSQVKQQSQRSDVYLIYKSGAPCEKRPWMMMIGINSSFYFDIYKVLLLRH